MNMTVLVIVVSIPEITFLAPITRVEQLLNRIQVAIIALTL